MPSSRHSSGHRGKGRALPGVISASYQGCLCFISPSGTCESLTRTELDSCVCRVLLSAPRRWRPVSLALHVSIHSGPPCQGFRNVTLTAGRVYFLIKNRASFLTESARRRLISATQTAWGKRTCLRPHAHGRKKKKKKRQFQRRPAFLLYASERNCMVALCRRLNPKLRLVF